MLEFEQTSTLCDIVCEMFVSDVLEYLNVTYLCDAFLCLGWKDSIALGDGEWKCEPSGV